MFSVVWKEYQVIMNTLHTKIVYVTNKLVIYLICKNVTNKLVREMKKVILICQSSNKVAQQFWVASNYCPSVASDHNIDPKVAGSHPFIAVSGQESCSSNMIGFSLIKADSEQDLT